jgi:hypothetical protein
MFRDARAAAVGGEHDDHGIGARRQLASLGDCADRDFVVQYSGHPCAGLSDHGRRSRTAGGERRDRPADLSGVVTEAGAGALENQARRQLVTDPDVVAWVWLTAFVTVSLASAGGFCLFLAGGFRAFCLAGCAVIVAVAWLSPGLALCSLADADAVLVIVRLPLVELTRTA